MNDDIVTYGLVHGWEMNDRICKPTWNSNMNKSILQALYLIFLALSYPQIGVHDVSWIPGGDIQPPNVVTVSDLPDTLDHYLYFPIIVKSGNPGDSDRFPRINMPYTPTGIPFREAAIHWFGEVRGEHNYTDMRVGYTPEELVINLAIFDRHTWYDTTPTVETLTEWDSATISLDISEPPTTVLSSNSFKFVGQLNSWEDRDNYQAVYIGSQSGWSQGDVPFTTTAAMRGLLWNDNTVYDHGWVIRFRIPYSSLGVAAIPANGTEWRLAVSVHDRDDSSGTPITPKKWPETVELQNPNTWGVLHFGLPQYSPPDSGSQSTWLIRHKHNGIVVPDAGVGGDTTCGAGLDAWNEWGDTNYAHQIHTNIQNQSDVSDWPCFSKHYVTFPLDSLPVDQVVISATLTLHQFGGSNPPEAQPSLIQVLTIGEDWDEDTVTWNNAPLALENISRAWVDPLPGFPGWPGEPSEWDLSRAVSRAYANQTPLRLAIYSADSAIHSGKYFSTSDVGDWNEIARPSLTITLGEPLTP